MKKIIDFQEDAASTRYTGWHVFVLIIAALAMLFDGFDYQAIAFAIPMIKQEWSLSPSALGALLSASFVGLSVGAVAASYIADRIGRKTALAACIFVYSIFTACAAASPNYHTLVLFRCLTGLGIGGAIPITVAWLTEFLPIKNRALIISATVGFGGIGWICASATALVLIQAIGWRYFFSIGALPAVLAVVVMIWAPESPVWLAKTGRLDSALRIASRSNMPSEPLRRFGTRKEEASHAISSTANSATWASLFRPGMLKTTIIISTLYFFINGYSAGVMQWLPTMLIFKGLSKHDSLLYSLLFNIGPVLGIFSMGALLDPLGRKFTFVFFWLTGIACTALFAVSQGAATTLIFGFGLTFFAVSTYVCLDVVTGELYPTEVRSSAVGLGMGVGRIGGVVAPLLGGFLLGHGISYTGFFLVFTIPLMVNILVILCLRFANTAPPARVRVLVQMAEDS